MTRANRVVAVVVGVVVVVAVVAAVFASRRPVAQFQRGTPEWTVQAYIESLLKGDTDGAAAYLASDSECDAQDLDEVRMADSTRVVLDDSRVEGDSARVAVEVAISSGGPLDGSEYRESHTFRLSRSGQEWRLTGVPWPLYDCSGGLK